MRPGRKTDSGGFRSDFRQAAYFGMLEPILGTNSNSVAQIAFQHCKTAQNYQYSPKGHLLCFYRGLFAIARVARQLSTEGDPLREGMEELHATGTFDQLREIMDWRYWYQNSDKFAAAMIHLPRNLDDVLTKASAAPLDMAPPERLVPLRLRQQNFSGNLIVLLVLLVVISQLPDAHGWSGKIVPLALMLAGLLTLRGEAK